MMIIGFSQSFSFVGAVVNKMSRKVYKKNEFKLPSRRPPWQLKNTNLYYSHMFLRSSFKRFITKQQQTSLYYSCITKPLPLLCCVPYGLIYSDLFMLKLNLAPLQFFFIIVFSFFNIMPFMRPILSRSSSYSRKYFNTMKSKNSVRLTVVLLGLIRSTNILSLFLYDYSLYASTSSLFLLSRLFAVLLINVL